MRYLLVLLCVLLPYSALAATQATKDGVAAAESAANSSCVMLATNQGKITLELQPNKAPVTVANFLGYVDSGFYDGTIFHRVIDNFMIQGGGFSTDGNKKDTRAPIKNESTNGLSNLRGSIAMARTSNPDSASAQFFINLVDNTYLDARPGRAGYAVFGQVIDGMETVDAIGHSRTHVGSLAGYGAPNVPIDEVVIESARRVACPPESAR